MVRWYFDGLTVDQKHSPLSPSDTNKYSKQQQQMMIVQLERNIEDITSSRRRSRQPSVDEIVQEVTSRNSRLQRSRHRSID